MRKAVAVRYLPNLPAPFVLAKGRDGAADKIVKLAQEYGITIVEEPELADSLVELDPGGWVPEKYYEIMAKILVFAWRIKAAS